jgi:hypothetical protein
MRLTIARVFDGIGAREMNGTAAAAVVRGVSLQFEVINDPDENHANSAGCGD